MLPARINRNVFETLTSILNDDDRNRVNEAFQLDQNPLEPVYVHRPMDSAVAEDPQERKRWEAAEKQLQKILHDAAELCWKNKTISKSERNEFHLSG